MKKQLKKVFVVFKTHFDIGFTHLAKDVVKWYGNGMIEDALSVCRATKCEPEGRRYIWTVSAWPMKKTLEVIESEAVLRETEAMLESGQLVWHALPFTTHTEACGLEDFSRGLLTGARLGARFGRRAHAAKMTDVPGHSWILPTILKAAGVTFLHLGSNFCATPPNVPRLFWWEGPDGSRLLTYYSKGGYGSDLVPPDDWEYPYWLAMLQTLDNMGAQNTDYLRELFERAEAELPGVEVVIGTLEDFADAMLAAGQEIPVVRGDLADSWIRGVGSAPQGVSLLRGLRSRLQSAEAAAAMLLVNGGLTNYPSAELNDAYEKLLLFTEHTWSMDTKVSILPERRYGAPWVGFRFWESGTYDKALFDRLRAEDPGYLMLQDSWQEQLDYLEDAKRDLELIREGLTVHSAVLDGDNRFTVFSALGRAAVCTVRLEGLAESGGDICSVKDELGRRFPAYKNMRGELCAELPLPAMGAAVFQIKAVTQTSAVSIATANGTDFRLENEFLAVRVDVERGIITSLFHKKTGREWVDGQCSRGFGQYSYDVYSGEELERYLRNYLYVLRDWGVNDMGKAGYPKEQPHLTFVPNGFSATAENLADRGRILLTAAIEDQSSSLYGNAAQISVQITLKQNSPFVDIEFAIKNKKPTPFIESGHFTFPLAADSPRYFVNKLGCVLDPQRDIIDDCNKNLFCLDSWTAVEDGGNGFAVIARDMPLMSYGSPGILRFDRDAGITKPELLMQGFNNAWGTNFPQWSQGDLSFAYRLYPYEGTWRDAGVWQEAENYRYNPMVLHGAASPLPTILKEPLYGLSLMAFKRSEDEKGYILRVSEQRGECGERKILFGVEVKNAALVTITEERLFQLPIHNNTVTFNCEAFGILTIYFEV